MSSLMFVSYELQTSNLLSRLDVETFAETCQSV